jgi:hypothetical protein
MSPLSNKQLTGVMKGNNVVPELQPGEDFLYDPDLNAKILIKFDKDIIDISLNGDDKNPLVLNLASSKQKAYEFDVPANIKIKLDHKENLLNLEVKGENSYKKFSEAEKYAQLLFTKHLPLMISTASGELLNNTTNTKINLAASFNLDTLSMISQIISIYDIINIKDKLEHPLIFNLDLKHQNKAHEIAFNTAFSFDKTLIKLDSTSSFKVLDLPTAKKLNANYAELFQKDLKKGTNHEVPLEHLIAALDMLTVNCDIEHNFIYDMTNKKLKSSIKINWNDKPMFSMQEAEATFENPYAPSLIKALFTFYNPEEKITKLYDNGMQVIVPLYKDIKGDEVQMMALLELIKNSGLSFLAIFHQDSLIKSGENLILATTTSPNDKEIMINQQPVLQIMQKPAAVKFIADWNNIINSAAVNTPPAAAVVSNPQAATSADTHGMIAPTTSQPEDVAKNNPPAATPATTPAATPATTPAATPATTTTTPTIPGATAPQAVEIIVPATTPPAPAATKPTLPALPALPALPETNHTPPPVAHSPTTNPATAATNSANEATSNAAVEAK